MTDLKLDDYTGQTYSEEDEQTYTIEVKTNRPYKNSSNETAYRKERLFFEVTHDSFMKTIGKFFEGKKVLERWQHWENPTEERKQKYPNARGSWVKNTK